MVVKIVNKSKFSLPKYAKEGDSGMDVRANIEEAVTLQPLERKLIPTGIYVDLPKNTEIQVRPRSGLALKRGITVLNTPGTVDEGYINEIGVILINLSNEPQIIEPGERIAQLVAATVTHMELEEVSEITKQTDRGGSGYGDSGRF